MDIACQHFANFQQGGLDKQPAEGCNVGNSLLIATMEEETLKGDQQLLLITTWNTVLGNICKLMWMLKMCIRMLNGGIYVNNAWIGKVSTLFAWVLENKSALFYSNVFFFYLLAALKTWEYNNSGLDLLQMCITQKNERREVYEYAIGILFGKNNENENLQTFFCGYSVKPLSHIF